MDTQTFAYDFVLQSGGNGTFIYGEEVYMGGTSPQNATAVGTVISWDKPTLTLGLKNIRGVFTVASAISGNTSTSQYTIASMNMLDNTSQNLDNNSEIAALGQDILDFSEHNPFGEP